jgi:Flavin containing amine oxidoreductase
MAAATPRSPAPRVVVVGGGIAGLTAALRLAERGYGVTLYERSDHLGGDLASRRGAEHELDDVYPHMFLNWYRNFWCLVDDHVGGPREQRFMALDGITYLRPGRFPTFTKVTDPYDPRRVLQNIWSGYATPADMFLTGYAAVDLVAERLQPTALLDEISVTGFFHSRPYMTTAAAAFHDDFLTLVWGLPSSQAAASAYQRFMSFNYRRPTPSLWLLRGPSQELLIEPLRRSLESLGGEVELGTEATRLVRRGRRISELELRSTAAPRRRRTVDVRDQDVVLAVPAPALARLVRAGAPGQRLDDDDAEPGLAELEQLRTVQLPVLSVWFNHRLPGLPPGPVGLSRSRFALAFTDVSQSWERDATRRDATVLSVSASDPGGLPGGEADRQRSNGFIMLRELARYLPGLFEVGERWGDSPDIDWARTRYESNDDARLFLNEAGSDTWRPTTTTDAIDNVCFAGDYCVTAIDMATVEAAVTSGVQGAQAIVARRGVGAPVDVLTPRTYGEWRFLALRYGLAPTAFAAKAWSTSVEVARQVPRLPAAWTRGLQRVWREASSRARSSQR